MPAPPGSAKVSGTVSAAFFELFLFQFFIDKVIQIPVHDTVYISHFSVCTVILYHSIRLKHIGTNLIAPCDLPVIASQLIDPFLMFPFFQLDEFRCQHFHGHLSVLVLRSFVLTGYDDIGRQMRNTDGRIRRVDVLTAGTA